MAGVSVSSYVLHFVGYVFVCIALILVTLLALPLILAQIARLRQPACVWKSRRSSLFVGRVWHTRHRPTKHAFTYPLFIFALDLQEVEDEDNGLFEKQLWPLSWIISYRPTDHLKGHTAQVQRSSGQRRLRNSSLLSQKIYEFVALKTNGKFQPSDKTHRIVLVTHLSYYGYCFNPVSFYYLLDNSSNSTTAAIVAEVSNTPWNEMYCYVLHPDSEDIKTVSRREDSTNYVFQKNFHVSPFMEMDYVYDWVFRDFDGGGIPSNIHVATGMKRVDGSLQFLATMNVHRKGMDPLTLAWQIVSYPFYCVIIQIWIHYEAFWLFAKGITFQPHPTGAESMASRAIGSIMTPFFLVHTWLTKKTQ
ncbi:predicted protein [Phaeodactylum tricornutum CCAP 1055/1]|uniref:Uncharacterized protein n=1 Tax=Phaeodactylum tricornutum (strain CCAP 1055/1) TaxID=556484 RepID=B7G7U3_PHATC|nr:predicted protein [Phaeodactylum tricornutum CCAP 1055/1]EEC45425.1 predicted protein [Phaeodactylum tricornutum CCAP 1055/1]|eukprot:XP_002183207.1 predicted protein [Phaeodactylum tricornutum CCAP 1055/1]